MDITPPPLPGAGTYPFLPHAGQEEDYETMIATYFLARLTIYLDEDPHPITYQDR